MHLTNKVCHQEHPVYLVIKAVEANDFQIDEHIFVKIALNLLKLIIMFAIVSHKLVSLNRFYLISSCRWDNSLLILPSIENSEVKESNLKSKISAVQLRLFEHYLNLKQISSLF